MWTAILSPSILPFHHAQFPGVASSNPVLKAPPRLISQRGGVVIRATSGSGDTKGSVELRTCRNCKQLFNPVENHPRACRFHTAHFGGETKRKFESVYSGGTMDTIGGGEISQYWHCCGASDAFDPGCEAAPHMSYDD